MRALLSTLLLAALLSLFGCTDSETVNANTQVTLRIQMQDAPLFQDMTHIRLSLFRQDGETWTKQDGITLPRDEIKWPIDIPIVPRSASSASKPFEAIVEALSGDTRLSQTRVIASYALNSLRVLEVWLYACDDTNDGACSDDGCHGPGCSSCSVDGDCALVNVVNASDLPFFDKEESPVVKPSPGAVEMDAGADAGDLGSDAGGPMDMVMDDDAAVAPRATCAPACSASAECVVTGTSAKCMCLSGFEDKAGSCQDIDECAKDNGGCSSNATCVNTLGGRNCACKAGFSDVRGDGTECSDSCATAGCDPHATCAIVAAEAVCSCPAPYVGNGKSCAFDESCSLLQCDAHATCVVSGTTRSCKCGNGYTGSGTSCSNINECMAATNPCGANSTCTDTDGAYTCGCITGYKRNGNVCENINDCSPNPCLNGGTCTDGVNSHSCACAAGYNGMNCATNINECLPNPCLNGGMCTDGVNKYTCGCPPNFKGTNCELEICNSLNITTAAAVQNARNCAEINGDLTIADAGDTGFAITANDFPFLTKVSGKLVVSGFGASSGATTNLTTLTLGKLQSVGGLFQIGATRALTTVSFPELLSVGSIDSVTGSVVKWSMPKLTTVTSTVNIGLQANLCTFSAPRVSSVGGAITLGALPKLPASSFSALVNARRSTLDESQVGCCFLVDRVGCEDYTPDPSECICP